MTKKLEKIRLNNDLSKKEFAFSIGLNMQKYSNLLAGRRTLSISELKCVVSVYNVECNDLLFESYNNTNENENENIPLIMFINNINKHYQDNNFVETVLINKLLDDINNKLNIKKLFRTNRPVFALKKILKNTNIYSLPKHMNSKDFLIKQIKNIKESFKNNTEKVLISNIAALSDWECFLILKYNDLFLEKLLTKVDKLDNKFDDTINATYDSIKKIF
jgi:transcriptional regulator with XRE-family HTH domain